MTIQIPQESTAILLALDGHDVVVANDGTSGVGKAETHRPDLILLDVGMRQNEWV